jgi:protein-disulfide isomerase
VKNYNGKVRVVYKNFIVHPDTATDAHLATCAAATQNKFMEFKEAFWQKGFGAYRASRDPSKLAEANLLVIAQELGLNVDKFKVDMRGDACKALMKSDMDELNRFGVNATPSFFINGKAYRSGIEVSDFSAAVDDMLKQVEASGVSAKDYYQTQVLDKGEKKFRSAKDPKPS